MKYLVIALLFLLTGCANLDKTSQKYSEPTNLSDLIEYSRSVIKREQEKSKIVGLSIALVDHDEIIWSDGFGYSDFKNKIKANTTTQYRAGSISKIVTTIAILQLVDDGILELDAPITHYIPEFSIGNRFGKNSEITIRSMLTHHSGLPTNYLRGMWANPQVSLNSLVESLNNEYTTHPTNKAFSYSNVAFSLLGIIVERSSKQDFQSYIKTNIFKPLHIKNSDFLNHQESNSHNSTKSYLNLKEIDKFATRDTPATGLNSDVLDLSKLIIWVNTFKLTNEKTLLSSTIFDEMFLYQNSDVPLDFTKRRALGWAFYDNYLGDVNVYGHDGRTVAQSSLLLIEPKSKIGIVVLANSPSENGGVYKIGREILRKYYKIKTRKNIHWLPSSYPNDQTNSTVELSGNYASTLGLINIKPKNKHNSYKVKALGRRLNLKKDKKHSSTFRLSYRLFGLFPIDLGWIGRLKIRAEEVDDTEVLVGYIGSEKRLLGTKISPQKIIQSWKNRVGYYKPKENLQPEIHKIKYIKLFYKKDLFYALVKLKTGEKILHAITTINDKEAIVTGLGRRLGDTLFLESEIENKVKIRYLGISFERT